MNIAFYDGILLQVNLHNSKATVLSKHKIGTDTIDFYNYFTKHRPSPEEPLLELSNFPANEAIKIISGQPLVNQFFSDYIDTSQENNQATAKEALAYTHNLVQNVFSDIDAALAMHSGVNAKGFEGNQMLFGADQFTMVFALLGNRIVQVYTVKDLREYLLLDLYYANFVPDFSKKIAICPCCGKTFRLSQRNKVYCSNPNIIELLGNDPELYVNMTPEGQMLLDNRTLFLTRRIAYSYGGFANDQLRRLQMGLLRNGTSPEAFKNKFEKRSLERSIAGWGKDDIFEISISEDADEEGKHPLLISGNLNDYPVISLKSLLKSLTTTIDQYEQPQHPKAQKDAAHINKHAMHIVRLYYTAFDILEKGEIITHRDKEREELLAIRNGKYLREDGSYAPEFFEFVDALEKRFQDDVRKTSLPAKPDFGKIEELLVEINKSYLRRIV